MSQMPGCGASELSPSGDVAHDYLAVKYRLIGKRHKGAVGRQATQSSGGFYQGVLGDIFICAHWGCTTLYYSYICFIHYIAFFSLHLISR
jgi:hypothetical protein